MNETKGYKNINLSDLGTRQKISQVASRVALFVPRLLGKLATKLVINPIVKLTTGQEYEDVRSQAVELALEDQREQAAELDVKIEEGYQNLEDWEKDTEYLIGNLGKYKSYRSTIEDLEKKQMKLITSPKKLLVGKYYRVAMSQFRAKHKEEKRKQKAIEKIKQAYLEKQAALKEQEDEIRALAAALRQSSTRYEAMKKEFNQYELDYASILGKSVADELNEQDLDNVTAGTVVPTEEAAPEVTPEEVQIEDNVVLEQQETPVVEQPENQASEKVTFKSLDPDVNYSSAEEPVYRPVSQEEVEAFRKVGYPAVAVEASPEEQALFSQMANMATLGHLPQSDASTLESYGLSQGDNQKKL